MALSSLLGDIVKVVRGDGPGTVKIDNKVFQLHYRLTTFLFLGFSVLVTAYNMLGEPVNCSCSGCSGNITLSMMNTYCWITSTYIYDVSLSHVRGLGYSETSCGSYPPAADSRRVYQTYYQWVPFMLALHGVLFYLPHWLWVVSEDGRMEAMIRDVRLPVLDRGVLRARVTNLAGYVRQTLGSYRGYFCRFVICDALNVINVVTTIFVVDGFLNGNFLGYGSAVMAYLAGREKESPFCRRFPRLANCQLEMAGPAGAPQVHHALCVLPLNVLNEKVYLVLWFWLIFLAVLSSVVFVGRLVLLLVRGFRVPMLEHKAHFKFSADVRSGINALQVGDFFLLSLMARNMDITAFRLLLKELAKDNFQASFSELDDDEEEECASDEMAMTATNGARKRLKEYDD